MAWIYSDNYKRISKSLTKCNDLETLHKLEEEIKSVNIHPLERTWLLETVSTKEITISWMPFMVPHKKKEAADAGVKVFNSGDYDPIPNITKSLDEYSKSKG